jgi:hypothetical protein
MEKIITIYHGSEKIVEVPTFGEGKKNNDFGLGFYCTESEDLAKEWAVSSLRNGFANKYTLDTEYMRILNLNSPEYTILNWIAVLVEHRLFSIKTPVARRAKQYLIDNFSINVNAFDILTGYRADDSYFDYAESFLNNGISVEQLANVASVKINANIFFISLIFELNLTLGDIRLPNHPRHHCYHHPELQIPNQNRFVQSPSRLPPRTTRQMVCNNLFSSSYYFFCKFIRFCFLLYYPTRNIPCYALGNNRYRLKNAYNPYTLQPQPHLRQVVHRGHSYNH